MVWILMAADTDPLIIFFAVAAILLILFFRFYAVPMWDRERIQGNVAASGGKVIEILSAWGAGSRNDRAYDVSYITASGNRLKARCWTSMSIGVLWLRDTPPDVDSGVV